MALGQHLDDLAESFLLSASYGGRLKTMKGHYRIDVGDLRVIRPLVYVRERQTAAFARAVDLPIISENCPACVDSPKQRMQMKSLLAAREQANPRLFKCALSALRSLMADGLENIQVQPKPDSLSLVNR